MKRVLWVFLALSLAACSNLPRGAAVEKEIIESADAPVPEIAVYPVTRAFLPSIKEWPHTGERRFSWIGHSHGTTAQIIRGGDMLKLVVWDSGENSLLTGTEQRVADLPAMRVSEAGTIFVPYVGKVRVAGRTPDGARQIIQRQLEAIVPSAQLQLAMAEGRQNSIDLVGGVNAPGNILMPDNNFSVLAAISAGGGVAATLENPQVKLVRGHKIYATSIDRLYENPTLDTRLLGGDKVIVEEDRRYFLSLGAAGREAQHAFNRDDVSALDALAIIGGVQESRGNPQGILILREYPPGAVSSGTRGPRNTRVVFTLDLTTSDGLFSARNFHIHSGDLVLATESPLTNTRTILGLVGSVFGLVSAANNVSN
ncbi:polysaccharide biosynthesis/export family protein [Sulfitobacter aestuariivivens]|uniref:Polysaccharide export protein n=2 Tax=Sulfitobacter aestuariivivens TaxID=2766981 RepID=A0A927D5Z2_9RHOB|nr:polysaccharide biosynthesis/export family protein [Sulfitobacter aestuariivivens]MBD3665016.1 polysaccharide export protein [Sulfitobacter aestuariivivens]